METVLNWRTLISIHAPSRERLMAKRIYGDEAALFQSTLPRGSDERLEELRADGMHFNPRSLAGATGYRPPEPLPNTISIHAPSRERLYRIQM